MSRYQIETTTPNGTPISVPIPDEFLDRIREEHARELADKIRKEVRDLKAAGVLEPEKDWAAGSAADLIDPEA